MTFQKSNFKKFTSWCSTSFYSLNSDLNFLSFNFFEDINHALAR